MIELESCKHQLLVCTLFNDQLYYFFRYSKIMQITHLLFGNRYEALYDVFKMNKLFKLAHIRNLCHIVTIT